MAAGRGQRLAPLTDALPKPMAPYRGSTLIAEGIRRLTHSLDFIHITVGYRGAKLAQHVIQKDVTTVFNTEGHSNSWWIHNTLMSRLDEPVYVLTCDNIVELNFSRLEHDYNDLGCPPALALRADIFTPGIGDVGREDIGARWRVILTRSYSRLRVHVNGSYDWATDADGGDLWSAGLGFDYPIGLFSKAVLGDVYAEVPVDGGDARVWAEFGTRFQLTNSSVLDLGLTSRLDQWEDGSPNIGIVIGLSRVFGIAGLVKIPPYPNPRID